MVNINAGVDRCGLNILAIILGQSVVYGKPRVVIPLHDCELRVWDFAEMCRPDRSGSCDTRSVP